MTRDCRCSLPCRRPIVGPMHPRRTSPGFAALLAAAAVAAASCASAPAAPGTPSPSPFPGATSAPAARGVMPIRRAGAPATDDVVGGDAIVRAAVELLGVPYRYGGDDPSTGLDCSGLVRYVFDRYWFDLPRTVEDQYLIGERVRRSDLQAGDLIFFTTTGPGATHVGIALGPSSPGEFVHAPAAGGVVRIERYDGPYWRDRIVGVRRLLPAAGGGFSRRPSGPG